MRRDTVCNPTRGGSLLAAVECGTTCERRGMGEIRRGSLLVATEASTRLTLLRELLCLNSIRSQAAFASDTRANVTAAAALADAFG